MFVVSVFGFLPAFDARDSQPFSAPPCLQYSICCLGKFLSFYGLTNFI